MQERIPKAEGHRVLWSSLLSMGGCLFSLLFLMKDITHRINYPNVFLLSGVLLSDINHASLVQCIKYSAGKCY